MKPKVSVRPGPNSEKPEDTCTKMSKCQQIYHNSHLHISLRLAVVLRMRVLTYCLRSR
jgi:hypothetical protein